MKADDPRLEESRKKALERIQRVNDLILTVLKNHLVLELFMNEFLDVSGKRRKRRTFAKKAELCKKLKPAEIDPLTWKVLEAGNDMRNKFAHTLEQSEIQVKMDRLRAAYLAVLSPEQAEAARGQDDVRIAAGAFQHCGAYLVAATDAVRARRAA